MILYSTESLTVTVQNLLQYHTIAISGPRVEPIQHSATRIIPTDVAGSSPIDSATSSIIPASISIMFTPIPAPAPRPQPLAARRRGAGGACGACGACGAGRRVLRLIKS